MKHSPHVRALLRLRVHRAMEQGTLDCASASYVLENAAVVHADNCPARRLAGCDCTPRTIIVAFTLPDGTAFQLQPDGLLLRSTDAPRVVQ